MLTACIWWEVTRQTGGSKHRALRAHATLKGHEWPGLEEDEQGQARCAVLSSRTERMRFGMFPLAAMTRSLPTASVLPTMSSTMVGRYFSSCSKAQQGQAPTPGREGFCGSHVQRASVETGLCRMAPLKPLVCRDVPMATRTRIHRRVRLALGGMRGPLEHRYPSLLRPPSWCRDRRAGDELLMRAYLPAIYACALEVRVRCCQLSSGR